ncbi:MAG: nucleotide exchange factor GrpE, partial [Promethearchaeota archaeon]
EENNELPENTIIEEIEKGYMYKDKVLKPAKVKISKKYEKYNQNLNNN